jgi:hypothetical protein
MNFMIYGGWSFTYPELLLASRPPQLSGLYAIQIINPAWKPLPYQPIYFGESEDLSRVGLVFHPAFARWCDHPAVRDGGSLYVSYLWLQRGAAVREQIERNLIERYRPSCNFLPTETRILPLDSGTFGSPDEMRSGMND